MLLRPKRRRKWSYAAFNCIDLRRRRGFVALQRVLVRGIANVGDLFGRRSLEFGTAGLDLNNSEHSSQCPGRTDRTSIRNPLASHAALAQAD